MTSKKLTRSYNHVIAGVCHGLGDYFELDPILVRIIFIILVGSCSLPLYIILWIVVPKESIQSFNEKQAKKTTEEIHNHQSSGSIVSCVAGICFILFGIIILIRRIWFISFKFIIPICFILTGTILIISYLSKNKKIQ